MNKITEHLLKQRCFRRRNYGDRAKEPIDDLLLVLDLLTPHDGNEKYITRKIVIHNMKVMIVIKKKDRLGEEKFFFHITHEILETLRSEHLIAWRYFADMFKGRSIARKRKELLEKLLLEHDRMHVAQTLRLKPGIYQHFKGEDRLYHVTGVIKNEKINSLQVTYEELYGDEPGRRHGRPLSMFTQVIARDGYIGPRWKLIKEDDKGDYIPQGQVHSPLIASA